MKVLFLDFDGVLNSDKFMRRYGFEGQFIDPTRMELLCEIIEATGAEIVLTTTWREHWSADGGACDETGVVINRIFGEFDLSIYDKTPELGITREDEIYEWLLENPDVKEFAVLDDTFLCGDFLAGHLVKTSAFREGLSEDDVTLAISILNGGVR